MNVLVFALLSEKKLLSKLEPLASNKRIETIYLIRKFPVSGKKIVCFSPPIFLTRNIFLVELYRLVAGFYVSIFCAPKYIIGVHYFIHSILADFFSRLFKKKLILLVTENPKLYNDNKRYFKILKRCYKIGVRGNNSLEYLYEKGLNKENKIFIPQNVFKVPPIEKCKVKLYDLIFIGNLNSDKRPDVFLKVVAEVKKYIPSVRSVILGDGKMKNEILKQIKSLSLEKNIEVLGYRKNVTDYLNKSKLLVMTSQTEGMPMVILEAMTFGVPCVVPDVGDITDVAINDYNSKVIKGLNIKHFSDAIVNCINDQNLYKKLSNNSLKTIADNKKKYSIKSIAKEWEKIIK